MPDQRPESHDLQPAPHDRGHILPRRASPETSVTLRHHRLAREAVAAREAAAQGPTSAGSNSSAIPAPASPRRDSSGDSRETGQSDAKQWFDRSNRNPTATYDDANTMDVDPPFFQKETDSSNEDLRLENAMRSSNYPYSHANIQVPTLRPAETRSSSADDYRSVIDDLTIENKRLKEELKRYKQFKPDLLRGDKLFELKVHRLMGGKKRELETMLRDFAAGLEGSSDAASSRRKKSSKHSHHNGGPMSKHASSSSSQSRPVDSAYASMSTGRHSSGTSIGRPSIGSRVRSSEEKVEHYLQEIPEALYPGYGPRNLSDKEKKKLIVKKLEQIFTGKISNREARRNPSVPAASSTGPSDVKSVVTLLPPPPGPEPAREARILADDNVQKKARSRDNLSISNSNSNGDQTESGGNGHGSGSGSGGRGNASNTSPPMAPPPEQRPTRPRDLDPDRVQIPSENMKYIRHLGLAPPELLDGGTKAVNENDDVSPDADGWVYLNLLSNLAQLHILNVAPDFIRAAVAEKSAKFQLSPDGRKIRWRGGTDGTKFSSDSSGDNSHRSSSADGEDGSDKEGKRKRQKTEQSGEAAGTSASSSKDRSKFGPQATGSSGSFHYKPLFVRLSSAGESSSADDTGSQESYQMEESNVGGKSKWDFSGSGSSGRRKKRRTDGAIVFYSGAPFCIDLSRDPGDVSPTTYMTSTGQQGSPGNDTAPAPQAPPPLPRRSMSGASIPYRPLSDYVASTLASHGGKMDTDAIAGTEFMMTAPDLTADDTTDDSSSDLECEFPWCDNPRDDRPKAVEVVLEPSGVGRVYPDDHLLVMVKTYRPRIAVGEAEEEENSDEDVSDGPSRPRIRRPKSDETTSSIINRFATMSTSGLVVPGRRASIKEPKIVIKYVSGRVRKMEPVPLPPPVMFYPPFSTSSESDDDSDMLDSEDGDDEGEELLASSSEEMISRRANPHNSDNLDPDTGDLRSGDEEVAVDGVDEIRADVDSEASIGAVSLKRRRPASRKLSRSASGGPAQGKTGSAEVTRTGSSVATAGGAESGYSSSMEE